MRQTKGYNTRPEFVSTYTQRGRYVAAAAASVPSLLVAEPRSYPPAKTSNSPRPVVPLFQDAIKRGARVAVLSRLRDGAE